MTSERINTSVDSCQPLRAGSRQPFYANAPPKPRRLNSSYEHSSTPDRSPERERRESSDQTILHAIQSNRESGLKGAESRKQPHYHPASSERRTPEAYGATSTAGRGDYEDVYGGGYEQAQHQQHINTHSRQRESFASSRSGGTRLSEDLNLSGYSQGTNSQSHQRREDSLPRNWHQFHRKALGPPRPHSADFLEYDRRHGPLEMMSNRRGSGGDVLTSPPQEPRSKSSVGYSQEGDFWSEENYALKMRESALCQSYLQNGAKYPDHSSYLVRGTPNNYPPSNHSHHPHTISQQQTQPVGQRVPPAGAATPDLYMPQSVTLPQKGVINTVNSHNQNVTLKTASESRDSRYNYQEGAWVQGNRGSPLPRQPQSQHQPSGSPNSNKFLRSASARLSRNKHDDSHNSSFNDESQESEKKMQQVRNK